MIGTIGTKVVAASYREGATSTPPLEVAKTKTRPKTAHTHARNTIFGFLGVNSIFLFQIKKRGFLEKIFFFSKKHLFLGEKIFPSKKLVLWGGLFFFWLTNQFFEIFLFFLESPTDGLPSRATQHPQRPSVVQHWLFENTSPKKQVLCGGSWNG